MPDGVLHPPPPLTLGYARVTDEAELAILRVQSVYLLGSARIIVQISVSQIKTINTTQQQQTIGTAGRGIFIRAMAWPTRWVSSYEVSWVYAAGYFTASNVTTAVHQCMQGAAPAEQPTLDWALPP
jgi:hypothetical protein